MTLEGSHRFVFTILDLFLATNLALLQEIKPQLRAVKIDFDEATQTVFLWFYFDGEISDNDFDMASCVSCEITATIGRTYQDHFLCLSYPEKIPEQGYFAYLRDESLFAKTDAKRQPIINIYKSKYLINKPISISYLILRVQDALLGKVRTNLRAIKVDIDEWRKILYFWFYFEKTFSQEDQAIAEEIIQETAVHFGPSYRIEKQISRLDFPKAIPSIGTWMYEKAEIIPDSADYDTEGCQVHNIRYFLLKIQKTLLGKIQANWRAVKIDLDEEKQHLYFWFYFDGSISKKDINFAEEIIDRVRAGTNYLSKQYIDRCDYPQVIPHIGCFVYQRYEELS